MVWVVPCKDFGSYQTHLAELISAQVREDKIITLLDCKNSVHQYLFDRSDLDQVLSQVFIARIERLHDLVDQLERISNDPLFLHSDILVVSSFTHLLGDVNATERPYLHARIHQMLARLEQRHHPHIIVLDIPWDTPYLRNARSSMPN